MSTNPTPSNQPTGLDEARAKAVLLVGAIAGIILVGVGLYFTVRSWNIVIGGVEEWHKNWWRLLLCELAIFGGLAVMFAALQLARSEERTNPGLRRLLYGYNAGLTSLLLLTILAHINVFAYLPFRPFNALNAAYDWTEATLYTLSPESTAFLQKLDKPVKVYVLIPANNEFLYREVSTLMDNVKRVNNKIDVKSISPDLSSGEVLALAEKYQIPEREGMLVVYGPEGDEKYDFIKADELFNVKRPGMGKPDEKPRIEFTGESAFIGKLSYLVEGKSRPTIYFTQGNGELDLDNSFDTQRDDVGLGRLRDRLGRANYEVKDLKLSFGETKVPDDAAIVVIARPSNRFPAPALNALREYMKPSDPKKKKGKMIVLFDVVKSPEGGMAQTGLEDFVKEFGVQVDNDRVVFLGTRTGNPLDVIVTANPRSQNPVVSPYQGVGITLRDVRTVDAAQGNPSADYQAEPLLLAPARMGWKETNLEADVVALAQSLLKPGREEELQGKLSRENLPVAVAVSELGAPTNPSDPHAFMNREQQPRMLVFGDATWVSNRRMGEAGQFQLFTGSLAWLRDRPDVAAATQAKERKPYIIPTSSPAALWWRMFLLPITLISLGIVGLGAGVWVVRRPPWIAKHEVPRLTLFARKEKARSP